MKIKKHTIQMAMIIIFLNLISCSEESKFGAPTPITSYLVEIDSITVADAIPHSDTLSIVFHGYVGPNQCHKFSDILEYRNYPTITFEVWAYYIQYEACPQMWVYIHEEHFVYPLEIGDLYIEIFQPDSTYLRDTVVVY